MNRQWSLFVITLLLLSNVYFAWRYVAGRQLLKEGVVLVQRQHQEIVDLEDWKDQAVHLLKEAADACK